MKNYRVFLLNEKGKVVLEHNVLAKNKKDAESKCTALVENCKDKSVVSFQVAVSGKDSVIKRHEIVSKRKNQQYTLESWMIANGKKGDQFYSHKMDKHLTAISTHHGRKITTERVIVVTSAKSSPNCSYLTKVTLL